MKMSGEMFEVDWAALAQQWIKMKETVIPPAPPPPPIIGSGNDGGGEAPMDMDTKDDDIPPAPPAPTISGTDDWNQWNQWGANWEWNIPSGTDVKAMGVPNITGGVIVPPPAPTISNTSFSGPPDVTSMPPAFPYNSVPINHPPFSNQLPGYWSSEQAGLIPTQLRPRIRAPNNRLPVLPNSNNNIAQDVSIPLDHETRDTTPEDDLPNCVLDINKRRQLPAWIREGLEKMEKEKQKAIERERQEMLLKEELEARKKAEEQARAVLDPSRSKFDSDSENEEEADSEQNDEPEENIKVVHHIKESKALSPELNKPRKSRFRNADSPGIDAQETRKQYHKDISPEIALNPPAESHLSKEEILQNLMLKVRRSLTEILLEVTNNEIGAICTEVWKSYKNKASTGGNSNLSSSNTTPLAQITRKLGLGIYGDSNSESEDEKSVEAESTFKQEIDSDEDLKETIRQKQQAFRKIEADIEAYLMKEEQENEDESMDSNTNGNFRKKDVEGHRYRESKESSKMKASEKDKKLFKKGNSSCYDEVDSEKGSSSTNRGGRHNQVDGDSSTDSDEIVNKGHGRSKHSNNRNRRDKSSSRSRARQKDSRSRSKSSIRERSSYGSSNSDRSSRRSRRNRKSRSRSHSTTTNELTDLHRDSKSRHRSSRSGSERSRDSSKRYRDKGRKRNVRKKTYSSNSSSSSRSRSRSRSNRSVSSRYTHASSTSSRRRRRSRSRNRSRSLRRSRSNHRRRSVETNRKRRTRSRSVVKTKSSRSKDSQRGNFSKHLRDGKKSSHGYLD